MWCMAQYNSIVAASFNITADYKMKSVNFAANFFSLLSLSIIILVVFVCLQIDMRLMVQWEREHGIACKNMHRQLVFLSYACICSVFAICASIEIPYATQWKTFNSIELTFITSQYFLFESNHSHWRHKRYSDIILFEPADEMRYQITHQLKTRCIVINLTLINTLLWI